MVHYHINAKYSKNDKSLSTKTEVACLAFRRDRNMRGRLQKLHVGEAIRLCADAAAL